MTVSGRAPATQILGLGWPGGAAALVDDGRLVAVAPPSGEAGWPDGAVRAVLAEAGWAAADVGLVVAAGGAPPRRRGLARAARAALGVSAGFVGRGVVGTGLPRWWDRSDRVRVVSPHRALAAGAYYAAGVRVALVLVQRDGEASAWLGTSGKVVELAAPGPTPVAALEARWQAETRAPCALHAGAHALDAPRALAAGAAWLGRADERQGAWVPSPWSPDAG